MRNVNRRLILAAATAVALTAGNVIAAEPVKIGMVVPLSGPIAAYGLEARQSTELAVEEINAAGGILGGRKLQLVWEDDKGTTQGSVAAVQKQIAVNKANVILGGLGTPLTLAAASVTKDRILYINATSQADAITEQGNQWLFQINNTTSMNSRAFNKYITTTMKPKTVAFVGENGEFTKGLLELFKPAMAAAKIDLVNVSLYDADTNDYTSVISKVKSLNPDLVYVADGAPARIAQFWKQARQMGGFRAEASVPGVLTPAVLRAAEGALNGVITGDIFSAEEKSPDIQAFVIAFRKKYNSDPGKVHLAFYEGMKVTAAAMDKAKTATDYAAIAKVLHANTWATPRGLLKFDEKGRANAPYFYIQRVKGESLELVERSAN